MALSQNGWSAFTSTAGYASRRQVPDTDVWLTVRNGTAGDLLLWVAQQFDQRVESIDNGRGTVDDGGWNYRPIAGSTALSNHASATAIDLNWSRHPLGAVGTFSPAQAAEIRKIVLETGGAVRWGGDYYGRRDEMHFEINTNQDGANRAWAAIQARQQPPEEDDMPDTEYLQLPRTVGEAIGVPTVPVESGGLPWGPVHLRLKTDHGVGTYRIWIHIDGEDYWHPITGDGTDGYVKIRPEDPADVHHFQLPKGTGAITFTLVGLEGTDLDDTSKYWGAARFEIGKR